MTNQIIIRNAADDTDYIIPELMMECIPRVGDSVQIYEDNDDGELIICGKVVDVIWSIVGCEYTVFVCVLR